MELLVDTRNACVLLATVHRGLATAIFVRCRVLGYHDWGRVYRQMRIMEAHTALALV